MNYKTVHLKPYCAYKLTRDLVEMWIGIHWGWGGA